MSVIEIICLITLIMITFLKTNAYVEYARLFNVNNISYYKDFFIKREDNPSLNYIDYLSIYHNCFFIRLVTCPVCLSIWLGIIFSIFTNICLFPIYSLVSLFIYCNFCKNF